MQWIHSEIASPPLAYIVNLIGNIQFTPQVPVGADGFHHQPPYQQFNEATPPVDKGYDNQALTFSSENENAHKSNTKPEEPPAPWIPPQPVAQQHPLEVPEADAHHDNSPMSVDSISVGKRTDEFIRMSMSCSVSFRL